MGLASQALTDKHQTWWHLSSIQLSGGVISIPFLLIGSRICSQQGLLGAVVSIIVGNFIGLVLSYFFARMGENKRLNAVENAKQFIGEMAGRAFGFFVLVDMIGWIALGLFEGQRHLQPYPFFSKFSFAPSLGALGCLCLLPGIKGLKKVSVAAILPLTICLFFVLSAATSCNQSSFVMAQEKHLLDFSGISLGLAGSIAAIVDYPTFFRHSKSRKDSVIALVVIFILTSITQLVGAYLFSKLLIGSNEAINLCLGNRIGPQILIPLIIVSMITATAWNVYAASIGWESTFPIYKDKTEYAVIGLVAIVLLGSEPIEEIVISTTIIFNTIISALGGIIAFQFLNCRGKINTNFSERKTDIKWNNFSWAFWWS